jgi:mono/diheme cytochrome c family protein
MYTGMLHTHRLAVMLFLVLYLIKTALLVSGMNQALDKFSAKTKIAEILISTLFLLTGIYLAFNSGQLGSWFWVKLIAVFSSIPLAIIAFKRKRKPLALLALIFLVYSYGISETKSPFFKKEAAADFAGLSGIELGKKIYDAHCISCHGDDGKLGLSGAKDLTLSPLSFDEKMQIVLKGKNSMMAYEKLLTDEQIQAVTEYVHSLKQP